MKKMIVALSFLPLFAMAATDKEILEGQETTPLKILCKIEGGAPDRSPNAGLLVQFVKDNQAEPGVYSEVGGRFFPGNKIVKTTYELIGESFSKVGHLDNGGKVVIQFSVDGTDLVGSIDKTAALFGDGALLYNCVHLKLK
jgi:hypothetical protein